MIDGFFTGRFTNKNQPFRFTRGELLSQIKPAKPDSSDFDQMSEDSEYPSNSIFNY